LRRAVTMIPAFVVVGLGVNATSALVISQVLLSLTLPIPMIALLLFTARRDLMGDLVNGRTTTILAAIAAVIVLTLNLVLLLQTAGVIF
jgi:manganese transport protein